MTTTEKILEETEKFNHKLKIYLVEALDAVNRGEIVGAQNLLLEALSLFPKAEIKIK